MERILPQGRRSRHDDPHPSANDPEGTGVRVRVNWNRPDAYVSIVNLTDLSTLKVGLDIKRHVDAAAEQMHGTAVNQVNICVAGVP